MVGVCLKLLDGAWCCVLGDSVVTVQYSCECVWGRFSSPNRVVSVHSLGVADVTVAS